MKSDKKQSLSKSWFKKGLDLSEAGKYQEALECFEKAIEINPKEEIAWYNKGVALTNLGKHQEALECFEKAIEINPNYEKAWYNKGVALTNLGKVSGSSRML